MRFRDRLSLLFAPKRTSKQGCRPSLHHAMDRGRGEDVGWPGWLWCKESSCEMDSKDFVVMKSKRGEFEGFLVKKQVNQGYIRI